MLGLEKRMQSIIKISCSAALAMTLVACGGSDEGVFTGGGNSSTNIISAANFSIGFDPASVPVLGFVVAPAALTPEPCSNLMSIDGSQTSTITVTAADKDNAAVSSGRVFIKVEYGTLDKNYCDLVDGHCSVEWSAQTNIDVLTTTQSTFDCLINGNGNVDFLNSVTAWTYGAEQFTDNNGDGNLSGTETYVDSDEPYLDRNDNQSYDAAIDNLTSADTNGIHDGPDGAYNGPNCDSTTRADCGGAALIPIYFNAFIGLSQ